MKIGKKTMKIGKKWFIISSIVIVVAVVGLIGATQINFGAKKNDEEDKREVVRRGQFLVKVRESGTLRSLIEVDVRSNVEGEIVDIFVQEADPVQEGEKLLKIDDEQIIEDMKQAEANRDARQAELKQAELRIQIAEKRETSDLLQAKNSVAKSEAYLTSFAANRQQRITEAETLVATTQNLLNRDNISLKQAEIALTQAKLTLDRNKVNVQSAKITLETTESEHERNKELFKQELISQQALEESQKQLVLNRSQYETAQKQVESQQETIKSQEETINAMKEAIQSRQSTLALNKKNVQTVIESQNAQEKQQLADLENARARLQQTEETTEEEKALTKHAKVSAQANLYQADSRLKSQQERFEWTTVTAPMSGTITRISVEEGEIITSGRSAFSRGEAIMRIADLSQMIVRTQINQVEIGRIDEGQRVEIRVDSYRQKVFNGRVSKISPSSTPRGQGGGSVITFEVEIEVDIPDDEFQLLPGMSADVDIIVFEKPDILQIPIAAVLSPEVFTVRATLNPDVLGQFQEGQKLKVQNLIGKQFDGQVSKVSPTETRSNLEILFDETPKGMRPGPTEIALVISENNRLTGIEAEIRSERQHFVKLDTGEPPKKNGEKGIKTLIKVGRRNNTHFEIVSGLKEGDRVFVPSMMELTKG
ncbi:HlyD family efflux transporter periplasmic adaptor subunit, partial [Candidatus Poribacteria bacterium]|nr:HlyD family efflux transporter periplasmic adaptor subunit [Candidatus Poribacteria bacterium]